MGIDPLPSKWGPSLWFVMHTMSFFYPVYPTVSDISNYKAFYQNLAHTIPCQVCREHYSSLLQQYPIDDHLHERRTLIEWVWMIHNKVNERLGKDQFPLAQLQAHMEDTFAPHKKKKVQHTTKVIAGGTLGALVCFFIYDRFFQKRKRG